MDLVFLTYYLFSVVTGFHWSVLRRAFSTLVSHWQILIDRLWSKLYFCCVHHWFTRDRKHCWNIVLGYFSKNFRYNGKKVKGFLYRHFKMPKMREIILRSLAKQSRMSKVILWNYRVIVCSLPGQSSVPYQGNYLSFNTPHSVPSFLCN